MLDQLLTQFLDHLRYERNVSAHTLRNYESDLKQFFDYLVPPTEEPAGKLGSKQGKKEPVGKPPSKRGSGSNAKRAEPDLKQIDHITIREWLSNLHSGKKKKAS